MSLATRLIGFFLAAMAAVLAGFSVTLLVLAWAHLQHDLDERLTTALDTLAESVDLDSDEVKWKPAARPTIPAAHPQDDPVRWAVFDDRGRPVDRTWELGNDDLDRIRAMAPGSSHIHVPFVDRDGRRWRLVLRRVSAAGANFTIPLIAGWRLVGGDHGGRARERPCIDVLCRSALERDFTARPAGYESLSSMRCHSRHFTIANWHFPSLRS